MRTVPNVVFCLLCISNIVDALIQTTGTMAFSHSARRTRAILTPGNLSLKPLLSSWPLLRSRKKQKKIEKELQEEDFLFMPVKPKMLIHERDFFRQSTRIQAWDEYVLVSIVCTSISYNALQSFELNPDHQGKFLYEVVVRSMIQIVAGMACLTGIYATMVFSLSILYGKTALGMERDPQYDSFLDSTFGIRIKAFRAFSMALALFALLVVLVLAEDLPDILLPPVGVVAVSALAMGARDWKTLVDQATPIYFDEDEE